MASIGRFGVAREPVEGDTFEWFEHTIRTNPAFGELEIADFMEAAEVISEEDGVRAYSLVKGTLRAMVLEEDFDKFYATAKRERQGVEDLMTLILAVVEVAAGRPTVRPSDSSDGPSTTRLSSAESSSSRVIHRLEQEGRPSIAYMVQQAEEHGSRASA